MAYTLDANQILSIVVPVAPVVTGTIVTWRGFKVYYLQGIQKRVDLFIQMRRRFKDNEKFKDPKLADIPFENKREYLGFFQELDLIMNSRLVREQITFYMFGYYARLCWESQDFWTGKKGLSRDSNYGSVFRHFVKQSIQFDKDFANTVKICKESGDDEEKNLFLYIEKNFRV